VTRINLNANRTIDSTRDSVAWGKNISVLLFAALLIVCSITVGCSSDQPKPISSNNQIPVTQSSNAQNPIASTSSVPTMVADNKPAPKKVVHKRPTTVNYMDKTYGVSFEYPRKYAIETGDAAKELLVSSPVPMNFVLPGGEALAAVELPETGFDNTDFSSAFFNVSVNKTLTAEQCGQFAVPQPKIAASTEATASAPSEPSKTEQASSAQPAPVQAASTEAIAPSVPAAPVESQGWTLTLSDSQLHGTEAVAGEGTRQSDSKYFHVFQNGACYEFAMNVTTNASEDGFNKHVDRDRVFNRLEKILATVKINPVVVPEVTAEKTETPVAAEAPAQ
jgi:hypothetical protein